MPWGSYNDLLGGIFLQPSVDVETNLTYLQFIPTIVKQLGWTAVKAQLMSIPIWICAMLCTFVTCHLSDKLRHRYGFIVVGACVSTLGYAILLKMHSVAVGVRYFAIVSCPYLVKARNRAGSRVIAEDSKKERLFRLHNGELY